MRKPEEHVELIQIAIPVLLEAVCVAVMIGCAMVLVVILATPVPA